MTASGADPSARPIDNVLVRLEEVIERGNGYDAFCPVHGDTKTRHLHIEEGEGGKVVMYCHHGCSFAEIMSAIDMELQQAWPRPEFDDEGNKVYPIRDHNNNVIALHKRDDSGTKKKIWFETPDGKRSLGDRKASSLPLWGSEVVATLPDTVPIVICEGEKAACSLTDRGIPAVGTVTGASNTPEKEVLEVLSGRSVILWPDADDEGYKHMQRIGKQLLLMQCSVQWFEWEGAEEKADAADFPGEKKEIMKALRGAEEFYPPRDKAKDGAVTLIHAIPKVERFLQRAMECGGVTGIRTGIPKLDNELGGVNDGDSYIVAARPNIGKSTLAGQVAFTAARNGHRVILQTPEMSEEQYLLRWACYTAQVNYFDAVKGRITQNQKEKIHLALRHIGQLPLLVDDIGTQTIGRLRLNIERHEPDLLVVDYLQYLTADKVTDKRNQDVGQVSRDLAKLKSDYDIPLLIACQLNREMEHRSNSEPVLSDLRDSGEIEQDVDVVLMLHRPDKDEVAPEHEDVLLFCRKNRMGMTWGMKLHLVPGQIWLHDQENYGVVGRVS